MALSDERSTPVLQGVAFLREEVRVASDHTKHGHHLFSSEESWFDQDLNSFEESPRK